jgi:hypothetical protein
MTDEYLVLAEIRRYDKVSERNIARILNWHKPSGKPDDVKVHGIVMRLAFYGYLATDQPGKYKRWKVTERGRNAVEVD